jgi:hypothetical protein
MARSLIGLDTGEASLFLPPLYARSRMFQPVPFQDLRDFPDTPLIAHYERFETFIDQRSLEFYRGV